MEPPCGEVPMRYLISALLALSLVVTGCPAAGQPKPLGASATVDPAAPGDPQATATSAPAARFTPPEQVKPERRVWAYVEGQRRIMDIDEARAVGLTVIDLSDDWVPFIFWPQTPGNEDYKPNDYMDVYVKLANDKITLDGADLSSKDRNYLEVYGIPPSLSVLRRRFLEDEAKSCYKDLDYETFKEYHGPIRVVDPAGSAKVDRAYYSARGPYLAALRANRVRTLEQLLQRPAARKVAERYQRARWQRAALRAMQARLACEFAGHNRAPRRFKPGIIDYGMRLALKRFERKHHIYGWGMIFQSTAEALGRTPLQNNHESLRRVIGERVVSAAGILEDGSVRRATFVGADGQKHPVRDLVTEFTDAAMNQLGLTTPERSRAFIKALAAGDPQRLLVAVQLPALPEYYGDQMELSTVIDRGDVWYDLPYDDKGRAVPQPRSRLPSLTLYTTYRERKIPLVRWRTTIGGWNKEMRGDEEYVKYKISDVGPRIWKNIIAGPVWVPPRVTPSSDMVKFGVVRGRSQRVVSQSTFGPGYASAYGLVAAFHVTKTGADNQIRTHGSVNYMSILGRYSHGCHRLFNYLAVRLFSFVLRHRAFKRIGQTRLAYTHRFEHKGEEYQINLHTRGYYYELTPPVPVNVLEGNIRGKLKEPIEDYVKKPGHVYQEDLERHHKQQQKPGTTMKQRQTL